MKKLKKQIEKIISENIDSGSHNITNLLLDYLAQYFDTGKHDKQLIAKAIGYHFWKCETDESAILAGMDCAEDVMKELYE